MGKSISRKHGPASDIARFGTDHCRQRSVQHVRASHVRWSGGLDMNVTGYLRRLQARNRQCPRLSVPRQSLVGREQPSPTEHGDAAGFVAGGHQVPCPVIKNVERLETMPCHRETGHEVLPTPRSDNGMCRARRRRLPRLEQDFFQSSRAHWSQAARRLDLLFDAVGFSQAADLTHLPLDSAQCPEFRILPSLVDASLGVASRGSCWPPPRLIF